MMLSVPAISSSAPANTTRPAPRIHSSLGSFVTPHRDADEPDYRRGAKDRHHPDQVKAARDLRVHRPSRNSLTAALKASGASTLAACPAPSTTSLRATRIRAAR